MTPTQWARFDRLVQEIESRAALSQERQQQRIIERIRNEDPDVRRMMMAYFSISIDPIRNFEGKMVGNYRVGRLIGEGAMGAVYLGKEQTLPNRQVAVKLIHPRYGTSQLKALFIKEINVYRYLTHHPHIVPLLSAGIHVEPKTHEEIPYSVLPYIKGQQSFTEFARSNTLDDTAKLQLFAVLCDALRHLHENGIIHGDLKPGNVLVDPNGHLYLIDFGLAGGLKILQDDSNPIPSKRARLKKQADDHQYHDVQVDIYALGILLGDLFAKKSNRRFGKSSYLTQFINRLIPERNYSAIPDISPADTLYCHKINKLRRKAMETKENRQYPNVAAMQKDIDRLINELSARAWYLNLPIKGLFAILVIGLGVEVFGYFARNIPAQTGGWLLTRLCAALGAIWLFLLLAFQYVKYLAPALNTTLFFSYGVGFAASMIGGLLYAFGPPAQTDPTSCLHAIWHVKFLRFMAIGVLLPIFYGSIFSLSAAKRRDPSFRVTEWRVMAWMALCFMIGVLIYACVHLTEIPMLYLFFGDQKQGDVRCEIFILVAYLCSLSLITYDNWTNKKTPSGKNKESKRRRSFPARTVVSFFFVTISGILLAAVFWGQGLTPDVNNGAFGGLTIVLISVWSIACHFLFTGHHAIVGWIDRNLAPACIQRWGWVRCIERICVRLYI